MTTTITHTPLYVLDLDEALTFYTGLLGLEIHTDMPATPEMRWLTLVAPGSEHELLLSAVDQHIPPVDQEAMRSIVAKGDLAVFFNVDDVDAVFESMRAADVEVLQEPTDQPYGLRDCAVRDPSGNQVRIGQPAR